MKSLRTTSLIAAVIAAPFSQAFAADKDLGFKGAGEAGYSKSTGNTDVESIYASLSAQYIEDAYKLKALAEAQNKREDGSQTAERYVGDVQGSLFFSDYSQAYGFGQARWENDRFEMIDLNSYYIAGLGYDFFNTKKLVVTAEAGVGYQKNDYSKDSANEDFDQTIAKLYGNFEYQINNNVRFLQDATEYYGSQQAKFESNTGLQVKAADNLSLKLSYKYRYNTEPAEGAKKEDTLTLLTLLYNF